MDGGGGDGGGMSGGGTDGGGSGGPTIVVTVVRADVLRPRELAIAAGASDAPRLCADCCAPLSDAEPLLTTTTIASTASSTLDTPVIALELTPRSAATALVSTVGAARLPVAVALSSRRTVKLTPVCSARRDWVVAGGVWRICRRRVTAITSHLGSPSHIVVLRASACTVACKQSVSARLFKISPGLIGPRW